MWQDFLFRIGALFRRRRFENRLDDELRFHYDEQVDQFERSGMTKAEARRRAQLAIGGVSKVKEKCRQSWGVGLAESVSQDIRFAVRSLGKTPTSTAVALATLALGIGASSAIISVVDAAMLRPLPYPDPEQLVNIWSEVDYPDGSTSQPSPSMDDMRGWQSATGVVSVVAGEGSAFGGRITDEGEPERIDVSEVTEDFLSLYGITPLVGRGFDREDMEFGAEPVAMLGYRYWRNRYGGSPDVIGETISLDDGAMTIVGVLPDGFRADTPVFRPLRIAPETIGRRGTGRLSVYARLRPGVTLDQAAAVLSREMAIEGDVRAARAVVWSLYDRTTERYSTTVSMLIGAGGLILLIACVNVAGLLLARGLARGPELATRSSLGAGRWRLVRQMLTESTVLSVLGAAAGIVLAWLALDTLVANLPMSVPGDAPVRVDLRVLAATIALLIPTTLLFGLMPSLKLSRTNLATEMARGYRPAAAAPMSRRSNQFLIGAEMALAVVLLIGAGLMIRTYSRVTGTDLGFDPDGLMTPELCVAEVISGGFANTQVAGA
jgi:predicted permease